MNILTILYNILIEPLQFIYETIYNIVQTRLTNNHGLSIIALSLVVNILVLPLYKKADAIQEEERNIEAKLAKGVEHIKKTFKSDEQIMMLQTYYRQNNYKPTYVLRSLTSLLLQIPFFTAAYNFLASVTAFSGTSFFLINDLSLPDGLIKIGSYSINALPILMTIINIISSAIYSKGYPLKNKMQLYLTALFFLVFLYNCPSAMVFYWTLNNLFSLVKTILAKCKYTNWILAIVSALAGIGSLGLFIIKTGATLKIRILLLGMAIILIAPLAFMLFVKFTHFKFKQREHENNPKLFMACVTYLAVLVGGLIPSATIASSAQEFVISGIMDNPATYIISSLSIAIGLFVVWLSIFYWLASKNGKYYFDILIFGLGIATTVNFMVFDGNFSTLNTSLIYLQAGLSSSSEMIINIVVDALLIGMAYLLIKLIKKKTYEVALVCVLAISIMCGYNLVTINKAIGSTSFQQDEQPVITLSKNGQNVVVIMLDRAMGEYIPYIFEEQSQLKDIYDGFTYYSNVISYGRSTNFAIDALFGGYEYTPQELNKDDSRLLVEKHNEALMVMPTLFSNNGFDVTIIDPTYVDYNWVSDLSFFDEYEGITAYHGMGNVSSEYDIDPQDVVDDNNRNFFGNGLTKVMPLALQTIIYDSGKYNATSSVSQIEDSMSRAVGVDNDFLESFNVLYKMCDLTNIEDNDNNNYLLMTNDMVHDSSLLDRETYLPSDFVDNTEIDSQTYGVMSVNGITLNVCTSRGARAYESEVAALIQIGNWLEYLKENDCYDNTRIIICSDHGFNLYSINELEATLEDGDSFLVEDFYPLLMVKDFNASGFSTSDEFMSNADVPTLASQNVIENPVNPFTQKELTMEAKNSERHYVYYSLRWDTDENNGTTFINDGTWYSIGDNIWDLSDWKKVSVDTILPQE